MTEIIAVVAILLSLGSLLVAYLSYRITKSEQQKRAPDFSLAVLNSYQKHNVVSGHRLYSFQMSVKNLSVSNNSVVEVGLAITYKTSENILMTALLSMSEETPAGNFNEHAKLPINFEPNHAQSFWCHFVAQEGMLNDMKVQSYTVIAVDAAANHFSEAAGFVAEHVDYVQKD